MKKKINALLFSCVIVMSGFVFANLEEASPFLVLSFLSLILFYHEKPEYVRNRRISGVVVAWLFLLFGVYDANRPLSETHYDITLPPIFDVVMIIVGYPIGYLLGYIYGAAKRDLWDKD